MPRENWSCESQSSLVTAHRNDGIQMHHVDHAVVIRIVQQGCCFVHFACADVITAPIAPPIEHPSVAEQDLRFQVPRNAQDCLLVLHHLLRHADVRRRLVLELAVHGYRVLRLPVSRPVVH